MVEGLWKSWWPTREPSDPADHANWRDIAYSDAMTCLSAIAEAGYTVSKLSKG